MFSVSINECPLADWIKKQRTVDLWYCETTYVEWIAVHFSEFWKKREASLMTPESMTRLLTIRKFRNYLSLRLWKEATVKLLEESHFISPHIALIKIEYQAHTIAIRWGHSLVKLSKAHTSHAKKGRLLAPYLHNSSRICALSTRLPMTLI